MIKQCFSFEVSSMEVCFSFEMGRREDCYSYWEISVREVYFSFEFSSMEGYLSFKINAREESSCWKLAYMKVVNSPWKLAVLNDASWKLALMKFTSCLKLAPEKSAFPKNCEPLKYTGLVNSLLTPKSERLKSGS
jgi:hypothetical protein